MKSVIDWLKKVSKKPLFLPLVSVFLVLIINVPVKDARYLEIIVLLQMIFFFFVLIYKST